MLRRARRLNAHTCSPREAHWAAVGPAYGAVPPGTSGVGGRRRGLSQTRDSDSGGDGEGMLALAGIRRPAGPDLADGASSTSRSRQTRIAPLPDAQGIAPRRPARRRRRLGGGADRRMPPRQGCRRGPRGPRASAAARGCCFALLTVCCQLDQISVGPM